MKLRRAILAVHRDLGFLFAVLTVVYAISGVAVNHFEDWNPNYSIEVTPVEVGSLEPGDADTVSATVLQRLGIEEQPRTVAKIGPDMLKIFLEQRTLTVFIAEGRVLDEVVTERAGLYEVNFLHLNYGKGFWTWFADVYAVGLIVLAVTGIFIIPGKNGIKGRGAWFMIAGTVIPLVYLVLARW